MLRVVQRVSRWDVLVREGRAEGADAVLLVREGDDADAVRGPEVRVAHVVRGGGVEPLEGGFWRAEGVAHGLFDGRHGVDVDVDVGPGREEGDAFGDVVLDPGWKAPPMMRVKDQGSAGILGLEGQTMSGLEARTVMGEGWRTVFDGLSCVLDERVVNPDVGEAEESE